MIGRRIKLLWLRFRYNRKKALILSDDHGLSPEQYARMQLQALHLLRRIRVLEGKECCS